MSYHNDSVHAEAHEIGLFMRLEIGELASVQSSDVFRTGINRVPSWWSTAFIWAAPGDSMATSGRAIPHAATHSRA